MPIRPVILALCLSVAAVLAACSAAPSQPTPSRPPVTTPEAAMAAIVAVEPRFSEIKPKRLDLIGQSAWYEARPASGVGAFVVAVYVGWGDCQAGCIDSHTWTYAVEPSGTVRLLSEDGPPVPADILPSSNLGVTTGIAGHATAGPVCPVETNPPDPACAPRSVAGARIVALDGSEQVVAETTTGPDGSFALELPAGDYVVQGDPVEGLMGTPDPLPVTVADGSLTTVDLAYDTGIR